MTVAAAAVVLTGCGARLTAAQWAALNSTSTTIAGNSGAGPSGSASQGVASSPTGSSGSSSGTALARSAGSSGASIPQSNASSAAGPAAGSSSSATAGQASLAGAGGKTCPANSVSNDPGVTPTEIAVGNVSTLTGPVPGLFLGAQRGVQAFAAYVNATGGVCGRRLVVKAADDNLDASQNATATQSLANQVLAFVGSFSVDDAGGAPVIAQYHVPDIGEALSPQRFNLPENFSPQPEPLGWNLGPYIYFKQRFGQSVITHMAVFMENQSLAQAEGIAQRDALESIGYRFVVEEDSIEPTQTDFSSEVAEMKAAGAKGLVFQATASIYGDMAKDMYDAGFSMPFADWGAPAYDPVFVQTAGPGANGAVLEQSEAMYEGEDSSSVPEVGLFNKVYRAIYNQAPDLFAAYGWMSGMMFVQGLNAGGAPTRAALMAGLQTITSFSAGGMVAPDNPAGKKPALCYIIIDVTNGHFVRDPADPPAGYRCDNPDFWYQH